MLLKTDTAKQQHLRNTRARLTPETCDARCKSNDLLQSLKLSCTCDGSGITRSEQERARNTGHCSAASP
jgi:hypothetical protein